MIVLRVLVDSFSLCFYLQLRAKIVNADFYIFNLFFICRNSCFTVDVLGLIKGLNSSLWLNHIDAYQLLNDDNPAVKITEGGDAYIFGTPWSGKTACYVNKKAKLRAIVRLKQAPFNKFTDMLGKDALMTLLPSFTALRWNKEIFSTMINVIENIITKVNVGYLECLPNEDAAKLNYESINKY